MNHPMPNSEETRKKHKHPQNIVSTLLVPSFPTVEDHLMLSLKKLKERVSVYAVPMKIRSPKVFPVLIEKNIIRGSDHQYG